MANVNTNASANARSSTNTNTNTNANTNTNTNAHASRSGSSGSSGSTGTAASPVAQVKLVLLGQAAVGKSCLVVRFVRNEFQEGREPTIGAAFLTQCCCVDNKNIKFEIWDTAGQERFHSLAPMYYRNAGAAAVVYDVTSSPSFDAAKSWVNELKHQAGSNMVIALVANKMDIIATRGESARQVLSDDARSYAERNNLLFFEASAKNGTGVSEIFTSIARKIPFEEILARSAARDPVVVLNQDTSRDQSQDQCPC